MAPQGASERAGYGFELLRLDAEEAARELLLTLRYRHALLDPEAAAQLMGLYREELVG